MKNILTVDLEDWFSVETLQKKFNKDDWSGLESVVRRNTETILSIFENKGVKATFFVLGWIADKYPSLVSDVASRGHEIACHSYYHRMVSSISPDEFRQDTRKAINAILGACGILPIGYRSPSWGMRLDMTWAFEVLIELGFEYDSSIFPIHHDIYGDPGSPRTMHQVKVDSEKSILEIPASTLKIFGSRFPIGGGGWLRQFPYWFTHRGIRKLNSQNIPAVIYFHPWEIDVNIPRVELSLKNRIRQYGNLGTMRMKVEKLLDDFDFQPMKNYIDSTRKDEN